MKSRISLVLVSAILCGCAAHARPRTADVVTEASVRGHLDFLAGDALNGRGSGTRDEWIAATYVGDQMRRWGIEPLGDKGTYVQTIEIERSEVTAPPVLTVAGGQLRHGNEMLVQSLSSARVSGPLQKLSSGGTVQAGSALLLPQGAALTPSVAAAAIVLTRETPQARQRWPAAARNLPRLAAQIVGVPSTASPRPALVVLDESAYGRLSALEDGTTVTLEAQTGAVVKSNTWNAIGRIRGGDPRRASEVILLTAHLDHLGNVPSRVGAAAADTIYNGADDDASGCVAVLELAESLAKGPRPKRTIIFTWFGSEEAGGFGARSFIDRPPVPLSQIVANIEFEMIARPDRAVAPHTLWLTGYERSNLGPELARHGARLVQDPHPEQHFFERSDNIQLARRGVIAQTVSSYGLHKEYHTPADEVRLVDFAHMREAIASMVAPLRWLADSSFKPEWLPGKKP